MSACLFLSAQVTGNAIVRYLKMASISHFRRCQLQKNIQFDITNVADYFDTVQQIVHSSNSRPSSVTYYSTAPSCPQIINAPPPAKPYYAAVL